MSTSVVWGFPNPQAVVVDQSVKKYVAQVGQTASDPPESIILQDTTGFSMTWQRSGPGFYQLEFGTNVPLNKLFIPGFSDYNGNQTITIPLSNLGSINGYIVMFPLYVNSNTANGIEFYTYDDTFTNVEYSTLLTATKVYLEIRVYP